MTPTKLSALVLIVIANPILAVVGIFVATFGSQIEEIVSRVRQVNPALIRRVGVIVSLFLSR